MSETIFLPDSAFSFLPADLGPEGTVALLDTIVQSSEDAIITKDLDGIITSWNAAATRIFGYQAKEMLGQSILRLVPERLYQEDQANLRRLRSGERIAQYETIRLTKSGNELTVSLSLSPLRDSTGCVIGASKNARDISRQAADQLLRFRLAAIVESSNDAILSKDLEGTITSWNGAAERLFGYTSEEMEGRSILMLIPPELHSEEVAILEKLSRGERIDHFETERLKKNGDRISVSLTISPLKDGVGKIVGVSKILRDISERKAMERKLMDAEKFAATEKMAATIAHEINNPLEALVNLVFLAKAHVHEPAEAIGYLETAEAELARIAQIAKQSLGYFRDHIGARQSSLEQLIKEALKMYEIKFHAANVVVETSFDKVPEIIVRQGEMLQVISNLLVNSLHAMPEGGVLRVMTSLGEIDSKAAVVLSVEDTGTGIVPENLDKIFEPFYTTRAEIGTGIGLWVSKRFVEGHGGRIEVESRVGDSHGTKFSILLPMENPHTQV